MLVEKKITPRTGIKPLQLIKRFLCGPDNSMLFASAQIPGIFSARAARKMDLEVGFLFLMPPALQSLQGRGR